MEIVEAIRSKKKIETMKKLMRGANDLRALSLFTLGINSGLRIGDMLDLKWCDVMAGDKVVSSKDRIIVKEKKTKRNRSLILNNAVVSVLRKYHGDLEPSRDDYIFKSRKGGNKPITRHHAWHILKTYAEEAGITCNVGTHTLRKTFGYQARLAGYPVEFIQKVFGHRNTKDTLVYIGIDQDEIDDMYAALNL